MKSHRIGAILTFLTLFIFINTTTAQEYIQKVNKNTGRNNQISKKIFPFLHWINNDLEIKNILLDNKKINNLITAKYNTLKDAFNQQLFQYFEIATLAETFKFSHTDIEIIVLLFKESDILNKRAKEVMVLPKFSYKKMVKTEDHIQNTIENELLGLNKIIDRYALAKSFKYKMIDSVSYDINSKYYKKIINLNAQNIIEKIDTKTPFYSPSLEFALKLLEINKRDESVRYEPMEEGENKKAIERIATINWDEYPYSVLLVPGHGPEEKHVSLSPLGVLRCQLAADRYYKKMAPFIIVSGGYVHPFQTPYCEAIEMKKELMDTYHIPEDVIIIEPHARHTTTNFRNAARLIFKYGIPHKKKMLCSTTKDQSYYITYLDFDKRCMEELGYMPYKLGARLNRNDVEFYPLIESLYIDNNDPLDP